MLSVAASALTADEVITVILVFAGVIELCLHIDIVFITDATLLLSLLPVSFLSIHLTEAWSHLCVVPASSSTLDEMTTVALDGELGHLLDILHRLRIAYLRDHGNDLLFFSVPFSLLRLPLFDSLHRSSYLILLRILWHSIVTTKAIEVYGELTVCVDAGKVALFHIHAIDHLSFALGRLLFTVCIFTLKHIISEEFVTFHDLHWSLTPFKGMPVLAALRLWNGLVVIVIYFVYLVANQLR